MKFNDRSWSLFILFLLIFISYSAHAQLDISKDSIEFSIRKSPAFSIYKDNYVISGTTLNEKPTKENSDIKFQFSFKQRIQNRPVFWGSYLYFTYTQKSFWDAYQESSPFAETNYNPGLLLIKPFYKDNQFTGVAALSVEHESNGRDSIYSRSWNFIGAKYTHYFSDRLYGSFKLMIPVQRSSDNGDLNRYIGHSELQLSWDIKKEKLILDLLGRKTAEWNSRASLMTSLSFKPSDKRNLYFTLQWWHGYAESLVDYKKSVPMLRFGLLIKPSFFRFY